MLGIDLRQNALSKLPNLSSADALCEILAGNNRISTVGDLSTVPSGIHILDLRDNKLEEIPAEV